MGGLFSEKAWAVVLAHKANFIQSFGVTLESAIGGILIALVLGVLLGLMGVSTRKLPQYHQPDLRRSHPEYAAHPAAVSSVLRMFLLRS